MTAPASDSLTPRLDAEALNAFLRRAFPEAAPDQMARVIEVGPGRVRLSLGTGSRNLRPGGVISGPTLMSLADTAAYALVLAHIGEVAMLKLGRRIATCDVVMSTEGPGRPAAKATVAYAIPEAGA